MCLDHAEPEITIEPTVAYKVTRSIRGVDDDWNRTPGEYTGPYSLTKIEPGKWMKGENEQGGGKSPLSDIRPPFTPGF